jgi:hypothetical protein|tara:strand:+ start:162 stop:635 length:474 start_codon:yes stop_codon:yes gene_type:complete
MADKKISALTQVADSDIGADDLLHIVDNPGGTPVNKKMTIGQMFENIPTHLAIDDIATLTATASNLASTFATAIDLSGAGADVAFTLDDGTDVGQLKIIFASTEPASTYVANVTVSSWGYSADTTNQIILDTRGEAVICFWNGSSWFPVSTVNATIS